MDWALASLDERSRNDSRRPTGFRLIVAGELARDLQAVIVGSEARSLPDAH